MQERSTFEGRYYTVTDAIANPKPLQRPHPPIWIGGSGERKTLRVVAEHANVWNGGGDPDEAARLSGVLDRHCGDVGRDPAEVLRSVQLRFGDRNDDDALRFAHEYVDRGFSELIVVVPGGNAEEQ